MVDADLSGLRVLLAGHAEASLVEATRRAFLDAGCEVIDGSGSARAPARAALGGTSISR